MSVKLIRLDSAEEVDLGSSNGTWVNGWPLAERPLLPADLLSIGEVTFRVEEDPT